MKLFNTDLCFQCKGRGWCKQPCTIYSKIKDYQPKTRTHFSGNSPPEIFVGKYDYPHINAGILTPECSDDTESYSMPEIWHEKKLSIDEILSNRGKLIYGKFKTEITKARISNRLLSTMQEITLCYKPVSTEFFLKKPPQLLLDINRHSPVIGNPAPLEHARLEENPKIKPKVEYLVGDNNAKSTDTIKELYSSNTSVSSISKILSAGLLGLKTQRKLVPTRWSITAVDDLLSKNLLQKIRHYKEINEIMLFNSEYNGNHYEIFLFPGQFSFEVLELEQKDTLWNNSKNHNIIKDYELFQGRKTYAKNVSGAYYANRLSLCEYLEKIRSQATAIFFREVRPEYYAPLGVGILREITRGAFKNQPEKFTDIKEALKKAQERLRSDINIFTSSSELLSTIGKQKKLSSWF